MLVRQKSTLTKNVTFADLSPESGRWTAPHLPKNRKMTMTSQFFDITSSSIFFDVDLFFLSSLVTGSRVMSISSLVLEI